MAGQQSEKTVDRISEAHGVGESAVDTRGHLVVEFTKLCNIVLQFCTVRLVRAIDFCEHL